MLILVPPKNKSGTLVFFMIAAKVLNDIMHKLPQGLGCSEIYIKG